MVAVTIGMKVVRFMLTVLRLKLVCDNSANGKIMFLKLSSAGGVERNLLFAKLYGEKPTALSYQAHIAIYKMNVKILPVKTWGRICTL